MGIKDPWQRINRIVLVVQYEQGSPRIQRKEGELVGVQVDDGPIRAPHPGAPTLQDIYRLLDIHNFSPVQSEFGPLAAGDIGGITTFKPLRRQVYQRG